MRNADDDLRNGAALHEKPQRISERFHQTPDFGRPAAWKHDDNGPAQDEGPALTERLGIEVVQPIGAFDERMTNIRARRAAETLVRLRLERQKAECDRRGRIFLAPSPPSPSGSHNRRSEKSGRRFRMRLAIGCVNSGLSMMTTTSGSVAMAHRDGAVDAFHDARQVAQDGQRTHDGDVRHGKSETRPSFCMASSPTPVKRTREPSFWRSAAINLPPSASPECSPVMTKMFTSAFRPRSCRSCVLPCSLSGAQHADASLVGGGDRVAQIGRNSR